MFFAYYVGPSVLLYGTPFQRQRVQPTLSIPRSETKPEAKNFLHGMTTDDWYKERNVATPPNELQGYTKYFSNQIRTDFDVETGERFEVTINSHGFRGRDFLDKKKPGVTRVVCLGASSTFGYFDRDDETYPVYLEQVLNEKAHGKAKYEVINLGIPHLYSVEIYNLFLAEAIKLKPDIVTFYEGNNDTDPPQKTSNESRPFLDLLDLFHSGLQKASKVSMLSALLNSLYYNFVNIAYVPWSDREVSSISNVFMDQISKINAECKKRDILFIVANQQKNSQSFDRASLKNITYKKEVGTIKKKLSESGKLKHRELQLLIHSVLMEKLKNWAKSNAVPFVDIISRLDHNRDVMVSWVHLSPRGNRMVAEAFAEKILEFSPKN